MIAGRPAATIALYHRRQVQPVDHLDDKPREMPLGKPFIERRRKQKPRRAVKLPEIAHQAHPAGESIAPSYPVRHMIRYLATVRRGSSRRTWTTWRQRSHKFCDRTRTHIQCTNWLGRAFTPTRSCCEALVVLRACIHC